MREGARRQVVMGGKLVYGAIVVLGEMAYSFSVVEGGKGGDTWSYDALGAIDVESRSSHITPALPRLAAHQRGVRLPLPSLLLFTLSTRILFSPLPRVHSEQHKREVFGRRYRICPGQRRHGRVASSQLPRAHYRQRTRAVFGR